MIKAKMHQVRDAFKGLVGIGGEKLPAQAAWRVGRLIAKVKAEVQHFEETQRKLFRDAGAVDTGGTVQLLPLERAAETDPEWAARAEERRKVVDKFNEEVALLLQEEVEIDYDPIPLSLFQNEKDEAKSAQLAPNDIALAGIFLKD